MDRFQQWATLLTDIGFSGLCDIAIVTLVLYTFLVALKRTRRSGLIFTGIVIVGAVYLAARKFNLLLTISAQAVNLVLSRCREGAGDGLLHRPLGGSGQNRG
jgi:hypothetical protein